MAGRKGRSAAPFRGDYQALLGQGIGVFAQNVRVIGGLWQEVVNLDNGRTQSQTA